jgi:hypothetical protein
MEFNTENINHDEAKMIRTLPEHSRVSVYIGVNVIRRGTGVLTEISKINQTIKEVFFPIP